MSNTVNLGGDRLGSGNKMKVHLHGFERSTHDLSYLWRSTMSVGTLVPFIKKVGLPGDTFDITLNTHLNTHPTIGPLFGSQKLQLDVFQIPIRLYQPGLHNNLLNVGMNMASVKLPNFSIACRLEREFKQGVDLDKLGSNPSSLHHYLGFKGSGVHLEPYTDSNNFINAVPYLAYYDIYKNYYANKQEGYGKVIAWEDQTQGVFITPWKVYVQELKADGSTQLEEIYEKSLAGPISDCRAIGIADLQFTNPAESVDDILYCLRGPDDTIYVSFRELVNGVFEITDLGNNVWSYNGTISSKFNKYYVAYWQFPTESQIASRPPEIQEFPLENIDLMREAILQSNWRLPFDIGSAGGTGYTPYRWLYGLSGPASDVFWTSNQFPQQGLALKTYQSDLFNNWVNSEIIDGPNGINEISKVSTTGDSFTIDSLNLAKKVYEMLNRIAVSGGTYKDWLNAVYDHDHFDAAETPIYCGGLSKEIVFQEVISNSANEDEPLGTLAGKGVLSGKHKGGKVIVKCNEPCYIIGIVSITPRLDYSQGNDWDIELKTLDDFHKPNLDQIGFQDLLTERLAWWSRRKNSDGTWIRPAAGKQPAWIEYMTSVNEVHGNFAIRDNQMYMVQNRNYEPNIIDGYATIKDLTTYIDPVKFNDIFAYRALDAQNYWVQISVDITARRKMSAKVMPNL